MAGAAGFQTGTAEGEALRHVEVVHVGVALALGFLQARPGERRPGEGGLAEEIRLRIVGLLIGLGGIECQYLVGKLAIGLLHL